MQAVAQLAEHRAKEKVSSPFADHLACVVELEDTPDLGSGGHRLVRVRPPPQAL